MATRLTSDERIVLDVLEDLCDEASAHASAHADPEVLQAFYKAIRPSLRTLVIATDPHLLEVMAEAWMNAWENQGQRPWRRRKKKGTGT